MNEYTLTHLAEVLEAGERPPRQILRRFISDFDINEGFWRLYDGEDWARMAEVVRERLA